MYVYFSLSVGSLSLYIYIFIYLCIYLTVVYRLASVDSLSSCSVRLDITIPIADRHL